MAQEDSNTPRSELESEVQDMKIEEEIKVEPGLHDVIAVHQDRPAADREPRPGFSRRTSRALDSPRTSSRTTPSIPQSPAIKPEKEEVIGGDITLKIEPGQAPKLSRKRSQKVVAMPPQLYSHLEDATPLATSTFEVMPKCHYAAKYLGYTEPPLECDCSEEWDAATQTNNACGEDSDCINRATKMECDGDCGCGTDCQNQRFQRKQYADVSVIKTDKKGFGLRANVDLDANDFIFEYIGEVIGEAAFRRRMINYDQEGIKHFYFMSLAKGEFVDATKKGNLGRFCNHSCNPNCYVDKWVVGDKLRMGIFAERKIQAGEELVFNYNVDRYGADPQPCYCGEPNCVGFIGGKTQTGDNATQLSYTTVEALGLEDADDWDAAVARKPRKRKTGEADEEYVNNMQPKELDFKAAAKVLASLSQCKEKWIAVKLLDRIQRCDDENVRYRIIKMHGYRILNSALKNFIGDVNICLQICDILARFPKLTRNKIHNAGIEPTMAKLTESDDEALKAQATSLLEVWSKLEMGFRIQKIKRDPNMVVEEKRTDRRETARERPRSRSRSRSKSVDVPKGPAAPTGPRNNMPQRAPAFPRPPPPFRPRPPPGALPEGWFQAVAQNGTTYFYNATGATTWQRPTIPALAAPPPPPPKAVSDKEALQNLINSIVQQKKENPTETPEIATVINEAISNGTKKGSREEKWKSWPEEKRKKAYENTIAPIIGHVMNKYKKQLDRDDLKQFAKAMSKKMVESDFKNGRVGDPYKKPESKNEKKMKAYVTEYFEKAVKRKDDRKKPPKNDATKGQTSSLTATPQNTAASIAADADEDIHMSENEIEDDDDKELSAIAAGVDLSESFLKRKAEELTSGADENDASGKRVRVDTPPPPPPPPPPAAEMITGNGLPEVGIASGEDAVMIDQQAAANLRGNGHAHLKDSTPMQTATPPTTGSPDQEEEEKDRRRREFSGMSADRMRLLGLDGAGEYGS